MKEEILNNINIKALEFGYGDIEPCKLIDAFNVTKMNTAGDGKNRKNYKNCSLATLGDAAIKLFLSEKYFLEDKDKAQITEEKSEKERNEMLEKIAVNLKLDDFRYKDCGVMQDNEKLNEDYSTLLEAVVGAIYLDLGFEKAKKFVIEKISSSQE